MSYGVDYVNNLQKQLDDAAAEIERLSAIVAAPQDYITISKAIHDARLTEIERLRAERAAGRNAVLEDAEHAMIGVFADMDRGYLFTSGFINRIMDARDAIRALKREGGGNG